MNMEGNHSKLRSYEIIYILLLPIAISFIYEIQLYGNPDGYLDPWLYFGYINNFKDLNERYGLPYYSVRFGLLFPHMLFAKIFGPINGFLTVIYSMYLLAGLPLYLVFRKYYSTSSAVLAYTILVSSVWFSKTIHWTYPDATAVPYLIASTSLIMLNSKYKKSANLLIGIFVGMALNSNFFTIAIAGLSGSVYLIFKYDKLFASLKSDFPWILLGLALVFSTGGVGYYLCCNTFDYFSPTISMIRWSNNVGGVDYKAPLSSLLKLNYIYLPPFTILLLLIQASLFNSTRIRVLYAVTSYLILTVLFFIWYEVFKRGAIIETHYYFSYLQIPLIFCIPLLVINFARETISTNLMLSIATVIFLVVPLISMDVNSVQYLLWSAFALTLILIFLVPKFKYIIPVVIVTFALFIHLVWIAPLYLDIIVQGVTYGDKSVGSSRYRLGLKFIESMPKHSDTNKPIYFWYKNDDSIANSLQSTYLWGYSRIMDSSADTSGLPSVKGMNQDLLKNEISLILFDRDPDAVKLGLAELDKLRLKYSVSNTREICEMDICYTIAVLDANGLMSNMEYDWKNGILEPTNYTVSWKEADTGVEIVHSDSIITINTKGLAWNYAAIGEITLAEHPSDVKGMIRLVVTVHGASAGIGVTDSNVSNFISRVELTPNMVNQEIFLEIENINQIKNIVISDWDKDLTTNVQITELEIRAASGIIR